VQLTEAGEAFYEDACKILALSDAALEKARGIARGLNDLKLANQGKDFGMKSVRAGDANRQVAVQPARDAAKRKWARRCSGA
jgi:hypothetical protein